MNIPFSSMLFDELYHQLHVASGKTSYQNKLEWLQAKAAIIVGVYVSTEPVYRHERNDSNTFRALASNAQHVIRNARLEFDQNAELTIQNAFYQRITAGFLEISKIATHSKEVASDDHETLKMISHTLRDILTETRDLMCCYPEYYGRVRFMIISSVILIEDEIKPYIENRNVQRQLADFMKSATAGMICFDAMFIPACKESL